jgi:hypothetical protein
MGKRKRVAGLKVKSQKSKVKSQKSKVKSQKSKVEEEAGASTIHDLQSLQFRVHSWFKHLLERVGAAGPRRPTGADRCGERSLPKKKWNLHHLPQ